jgi:hypothetical protein
MTGTTVADRFAIRLEIAVIAARRAPLVTPTLQNP